MIMYIENGTFSSLQYLEVVDLSSNSLDAVPRELLTLPNLRKLYMNNNRLTSSAGLLNSPPSQSLEFLSLAKCHLKQFPPLDVYPFLKNLNLSGNELRTLSTQQLAPMCILQSLDLTGNSYLFQDGDCDCFVVESWIEKREIHMPHDFKFSCSTGKQSILNNDPFFLTRSSCFNEVLGGNIYFCIFRSLSVYLSLVSLCFSLLSLFVYLTGAQITILRGNASSPPSTAVT